MPLPQRIRAQFYNFVFDCERMCSIATEIQLFDVFFSCVFFFFIFHIVWFSLPHATAGAGK